MTNTMVVLAFLMIGALGLTVGGSIREAAARLTALEQAVATLEQQAP